MPTITTLLIASALVFNVVDGDTLDINGTRVRLVDIDTPELSGARCPAERKLAIAAKRRLQALLATGAVEYTISARDLYGHKDRWGRAFAKISVNGLDVGATLIAEGYALRWTPGMRSKAERLSIWCSD